MDLLVPDGNSITANNDNGTHTDVDNGQDDQVDNHGFNEQNDQHKQGIYNRDDWGDSDDNILEEEDLESSLCHPQIFQLKVQVSLKIHNDMKDEVESKKKKGFTSFTENGRRSLQGRFSSLGTKWVLESGTIVEDVLYEAGEKLLVYHPIHSFMIDLQDTYTQKLFSIQDWDEIKNDIPRTTPYADSTKDYLDSFSNVKTTERLRAMLKTRPDDVEMELAYICLSKW
ncbi:hypothetical protein FBU30_001076 [Linnemannia zychae]|nr:hypothetical protein FBU30_001076 [Linnemannia zychae]